MSWPPKKDDLKPIRISIDYIPHLLVFSVKTLESSIRKNNKRERSFRTRYCFYSVTNGAVVKTPKSVLFPSIVKALCNNTEIVKPINKCAQGASCDLVEEIEMEYASEVINEQRISLTSSLRSVIVKGSEGPGYEGASNEKPSRHCGQCITGMFYLERLNA